LFIYVNKGALARPEVKSFARFHLAPESAQYVTKVGYVPLPAAALKVETARLDKGVTGSVFGGLGSVVGLHLDTFDDEEKIKAQLVQ
jgi:phosphate transport system substrate-binding protein